MAQIKAGSTKFYELGFAQVFFQLLSEMNSCLKYKSRSSFQVGDTKFWI